MKKITTIFLTTCLTFLFIVQTTNIQAQTWPPAGMQGDGSSETPWQITTAEQLAALAAYVNANNGNATYSKYYKLMNDIDLIGYVNWPLIGNYASFSDNRTFQGNFDGNGKVVRNLRISNGTSSYNGLFGHTRYATIKNIGIVNCYVRGREAGGLVGRSYSGVISNCYVTGSVGEISISSYVGGLVGYNWGASISNCYTTCNVSGTRNIGGLVGHIYSGTMSNCYATGNISATAPEGHVGGLAGSSYGTIRNCIAANESVITTSNTDIINRVCGLSTGPMQNNYALGSMTVQNSNGNVPITDGSNEAGTAQTIATLESFAFYTTVSNWYGNAWDIFDPTGIWKICNVEGLPFLRWQDIECPSTPPSGKRLVFKLLQQTVQET